MADTSAVDQNYCRYPDCQTTGGCQGVCSKRETWQRYLPYSGDKATEQHDKLHRWNDCDQKRGKRA